jgi:putative glutathione S-transferase
MARYVLYFSYACPFSHRVLLLRAMRDLRGHIAIQPLDPVLVKGNWHLPDKRALREIYALAGKQGQATPPVLWDTATRTIVSNDSRSILKILDPELMSHESDACVDAIHATIAAMVYAAGKATKQAEYDEAIETLFVALDHWEAVLGRRRWTCGDRITHADLCLFPTLYRFDLVYYSLFKCNLRQLCDYPNLMRFVKEMYAIDGVAETCKEDEIKRHYYLSYPELDPRSTIPKGPLYHVGH